MRRTSFARMDAEPGAADERWSEPGGRTASSVMLGTRQTIADCALPGRGSSPAASTSRALTDPGRALSSARPRQPVEQPARQPAQDTETSAMRQGITAKRRLAEITRAILRAASSASIRKGMR